MQLINHFHLNFTFLNLYLKDTLLRPTCRASTPWRDLIRMFKRSLEKREKPHHMQKQRQTGGVPMEHRESHNTIWNPDGPVTPQKKSQTEPQRNSLKLPLRYHLKAPPKRHQPTEIRDNGIQLPPLHQNHTPPPTTPHIAWRSTSTQVIADIIRSKFTYTGFMSG